MKQETWNTKRMLSNTSHRYKPLKAGSVMACCPGHFWTFENAGSNRRLLFTHSTVCKRQAKFVETIWISSILTVYGQRVGKRKRLLSIDPRLCMHDPVTMRNVFTLTLGLHFGALCYYPVGMLTTSQTDGLGGEDLPLISPYRRIRWREIALFLLPCPLQ